MQRFVSAAGLHRLNRLAQRRHTLFEHLKSARVERGRHVALRSFRQCAVEAMIALHRELQASVEDAEPAPGTKREIVWDV